MKRSLLHRPATWPDLPAISAPATFIAAMNDRYGRFERATEVRRGPTDGAHRTVVRFRLEFEVATCEADMTIRQLVDQASATGDLSFLGRTRIERIVIYDRPKGDLLFPTSE